MKAAFKMPANQMNAPTNEIAVNRKDKSFNATETYQNDVLHFFMEWHGHATLIQY